jgi:UDP-hydrolysing UDP-N-acetyl-D-glucosamine 2-epimerase
LELNLIVAGMHLSKTHGSSIKEIQKDGFKISSKVNMIPQGNSSYSMSKALGEGIIKFSEIFRKLKPDINLILGDRDEAFASALAASHMNIPNAHIHGGDRTMAGIDEYIRHAITKISNIHFAATAKSKERIIRLGENPKYVFFTGSPSIDEIKNKKISTKNQLKIKYNMNITGEEIILLFHPVTTQIKSSDIQIHKILNAIVKLKKPTICISPNSDPGNLEIINALKKYEKKSSFIKLYSNFPRSDYLGLLKNCGILVGNSSSGIIEASFFKIPVVNVGIRQKDRELGKTIINVSNSSTPMILNAIKKALNTKSNDTLTNSNIYGNGSSSKKIVKILENIKITKQLIQKQISY